MELMKMPFMASIRDASKQTGLSYDYLRKLCLEKKIVFVKSGNKYMINMDKLIVFLNTGEREG